ncbi:PAS domain S-box protein [Leeia sp. TBRC 13508]|uniref:PAS domain S-box protein n=1 Tax=Leeia speluncae TaxID=2884804 RepID=A0ABS8D8K5_9NEIS|nr:PAS domain-containing protein [Leeia speluncae]MCB6184530.1 PAS domain S-box protein [Leeia speluncae]
MNQHARLWNSAPVLFDVISSDDRIVYVNQTEETYLGFKVGELTGVSTKYIYPDETRQLFQDLLVGKRQSPIQMIELKVTGSNGVTYEFAASTSIIDDPDFGRCLSVVKMPLGNALANVKRLERENEVLSSIISTARDASYCVEYTEPVDMTAPEHEIIRQIFQNQCIWRYCNEAMSRLYRLPIGDDINNHDVRAVFARNPENESFVRELINHNFHIDGALAHDHRFDGVDMFVENDVRADIRDNQLYRFWGTVRDLNSRKRREMELKSQANSALDILGAIPDPVIVVDSNGRIDGANTAVEWSLDWKIEHILGISLDHILDTSEPITVSLQMAKPARVANPIPAFAMRRNGARVKCLATIASTSNEFEQGRCVITLRLPKQDSSQPVVGNEAFK